MNKNGNGNGFWKAVGLGWILGCFTNLMCFLRFGLNALWSLSILGVCVLVLVFLQRVKYDVDHPGVVKSVAKATDDDRGGKTLSSRLRVWK